MAYGETFSWAILILLVLNDRLAWVNSTEVVLSGAIVVVFSRLQRLGSTTGFWTSRPAVAFVCALGPVLTAVGLALAALGWLAGWRRYRNFDF